MFRICSLTFSDGRSSESGPSNLDQTKDGTVSRASTPSVENLSVNRKPIKTKTPSSSVRDQESPSPAPSESKRKRVQPQTVSSASTIASVSTPTTTTTNVGPAPNVESEEVFKNKREIRIKIPEELRPILVDDWDLITKQMKIVRIPASPTVAEILNDYVEEKKNSKNMTSQKLRYSSAKYSHFFLVFMRKFVIFPLFSSQICEITKGIRSYFDVVLGIQLLYKFERPQFTDVLQKNEGKMASEIYGFIHLLRLFVKFGQMLAFTPFDDKSLDLILSHLKDVLNYMKKIKPKEKDIGNEYETASPEYQRLAYN